MFICIANWSLVSLAVSIIWIWRCLCLPRDILAAVALRFRPGRLLVRLVGIEWIVGSFQPASGRKLSEWGLTGADGDIDPDASCCCRVLWFWLRLSAAAQIPALLVVGNTQHSRLTQLGGWKCARRTRVFRLRRRISLSPWPLSCSGMRFFRHAKLIHRYSSSKPYTGCCMHHAVILIWAQFLFS